PARGDQEPPAAGRADQRSGGSGLHRVPRPVGRVGLHVQHDRQRGRHAALALVVGMLFAPRKRRMRRLVRAMRREAKRLPLIIWIVAIASLPGCSCGSKPCGDTDCMAGTLEGAVGRWTSIAGDDKRVMVATYDQAYGDLVVADATDPNNLVYKTVD